MAKTSKTLGSTVKGASLSKASQTRIQSALKKTLAAELKKEGFDPKLAGDVSSHARW
jgi:hypothetical protein